MLQSVTAPLCHLRSCNRLASIKLSKITEAEALSFYACFFFAFSQEPFLLFSRL